MNKNIRCLLFGSAFCVFFVLLPHLTSLAGTNSSGDNQSPNDTYSCDCIGPVGNIDCDFSDNVDITDLTLLIDHLFISFTRLPNREEANIDNDSKGIVDITDLTALIDHLFITLAVLPQCPKPPNAPPETFLIAPSSRYGPSDYINSIVPGTPSSGVETRWLAFDIVDFPHFNPTFEFRWRVYGPYFADSSGLNRWDSIRNQFVKKVFFLRTGEILPYKEGNTFIICDTVPVPIGVDSVDLVITCDTVIVDTIQVSNTYGKIDTLFNILDTAFSLSSDNRIADSSWNGSSAWVTNKIDTLYDLFRSFPSDTTRSAKFVFWVQSRDPVDSLILDPTPEFNEFKVFDPKFEHDIAVINLMLGTSVNAVIRDSTRAYWQRAISNWNPAAGYVDSLDYHMVSQSFGNDLPLEFLLSHKVAIMYSDDTKAGVLRPVLINIMRAQDVGLSAWLMGRSPLVGAEGAAPKFTVTMPTGYEKHFGVADIVYSGWDYYARAHTPFQRIEDFIGGTSTQPSFWPDISIDSTRLFERYRWSQHAFPNRGVHPFISNLGPDSNQFALPEVDYLVPASGAEVMYTYNSLYGPNHFLGPQFSFQNKPVAVRLETPNFRSAHWLFTPYAFDDATIQQVVDSMLDWLIDSTFKSAPLNLKIEAGIETTGFNRREGR